jgi:adenine-specific DNA-methyltransferase
MQVELHFPGKQSLSSILREAPDAKLRAVTEHGQARFDGWQNLLILGDNLAVLKTLLHDQEIAREVALVYIDPPFSSNHAYKAGKKRTATVSASERDETAYEDRLVGDEYLRFLWRRLVLLQQLLSDRGSIYVHIDWKMGHYVKVLLDEVFGTKQFLNDITRVKCNPKNFDRRAFGNIKDMIIFYAKGQDYVWKDSRQPFTRGALRRLFPKADEHGRKYTTTPLHAPGETVNGPTGKPWKSLRPPAGRHWRYPPEELSRLDRAGLIEWSAKGNPRKKVFADEIVRRGKKRQDIWFFKDPPYPQYPTEKNLQMLKTIVRTSSNPDEIVLDCFAGSGTALVAGEELGRRWIGIDNSPIAIDIAKRRLLSIKNVRAFCVLRQANLVGAATK